MKKYALIFFLPFYSTFLYSQMQIKASSTVAVHFNQDGRIGIGTTTPISGALLSVNGRSRMSGFRLGTTAPENYVLTANSSGVGAWQVVGTPPVVWDNINTIKDETFNLALRIGTENDPSYSNHMVYRFLTSPNERRVVVRNDNDNAGYATIKIQADTARLLLKSVDTARPVELRASTKEWPNGFELGLDNRLYTNAGIVSDGDTSIFVNNFRVGMYENGNPTVNGAVGIGNLGDPPGQLAMEVYGESQFYGNMVMPNLRSNTNGRKLRIDANDQFRVYNNTSSIRFKENIRPLSRKFSLLLSITPIEFTYKDSKIRSIGYAAEQLSDFDLDDLIIRDQFGRPDAIEYEKVAIYLLEIIKGQRQRLDALNNKLKNTSIGRTD